MSIYKTVRLVNKNVESTLVDSYFAQKWKRISKIVDESVLQKPEDFTTFFKRFIKFMKLKVASGNNHNTEFGSLLLERLFRRIFRLTEWQAVPKSVFILKAFVKLVIREFSMDLRLADNSADESWHLMDENSFKLDATPKKRKSKIIKKRFSQLPSNEFPEINQNNPRGSFKKRNFDNPQQGKSKNKGSIVSSIKEIASEKELFNKKLYQYLNNGKTRVKQGLTNSKDRNSMVKEVKAANIGFEGLIDKNLNFLFFYYGQKQHARLKTKSVLGEYNIMQRSLSLSDFLNFCEDFSISLSQNKIVNIEELTLIFKIVSFSKKEISYEKFTTILKHVAKLDLLKRKNKKSDLNTHSEVATTKFEKNNEESIPSFKNNKSTTLCRRLKNVHYSTADENQSINEANGNTQAEKLDYSLKNCDNQGQKDSNLVLKEFTIDENSDGFSMQITQSEKPTLQTYNDGYSDAQNSNPNFVESIDGNRDKRHLSIFSRSRNTNELFRFIMESNSDSLEKTNEIFYLYMRRKNLHDSTLCMQKKRNSDTFLNQPSRTGSVIGSDNKDTETKSKNVQVTDKSESNNKTHFYKQAKESENQPEKSPEYLLNSAKPALKSKSVKFVVETGILPPLRTISKMLPTKMKSSYSVNAHHKSLQTNIQIALAAFVPVINRPKGSLKAIVKVIKNSGASPALQGNQLSLDKRSTVKIQGTFNSPKLFDN
jgi:hypothetical protein